MQEAPRNEFSFGPQQIRARARLGSAALWIPEPRSAQGERDGARDAAAAPYSATRAKKIILKLR